MPILVAPALETHLAHQSGSFGSLALNLWRSELVLYSVVAGCDMCTMNHPFCYLNGRKEVGWAILTTPGESRMEDGPPVAVWPRPAPAAGNSQVARSWERARGPSCSHYRLSISLSWSTGCQDAVRVVDNKITPSFLHTLHFFFLSFFFLTASSKWAGFHFHQCLGCLLWDIWLSWE